MPSHYRIELGARLRELRTSAGFTLQTLSDELRKQGVRVGTSPQNLSQIELGNSWPSADLLRRIEAVLGRPGELLYLLREAKVPTVASHPDGGVLATGHLFYPLFVQDVPEPTEGHAPGRYDFVPRLGLTPCASGTSAVHSFPFNVVVLHEAHALAAQDLSTIALWRQAQILRCATAAVEQLAELQLPTVARDHDPYCFSVFVVNEVPWQDEALRIRATQLLAVPTVLTSGDPAHSARDREEGLLRSSAPLGDIVDFSFPGGHIGFASWAAVALLPADGAAAIVEALIEFELQLQAFWCYASNTEARGACINAEFGEDFLRQVLRKLQRPWPTEHTSVRGLREALVQTSRVTDLVDSALEAVHVKRGTIR